MQIGIQLYTLRDMMKDAAGYRQTLKEVKSIGYNAVEIAGVPEGITPDKLRVWTSDLGLEVIGSHEGKDKMANNLADVISFNQIVGSRYVVLSYVATSELDTSEQINALISFLEATGRTLEKSNLSLLYHNHGHELSMKIGRRPIPVLAHMIDNTDISFVNFELDVYWTKFGGEFPGSFIMEYPSSFPVLHMKDGVLGKAKPEFRELGQGDMDFNRIFEAIKADKDISWLVYEQDANFRQNPLESARQSFLWLQEQLRKHSL